MTKTPGSKNNITKWSHDWASIQEDLIPHSLDTIDSTNIYARDLPRLKKDQVVFSETQTQGRGRNKKSWISPQKGSALLSSWIFDRAFAPQPILAPLVGLSLVEALYEISGFDGLSLKAPNDIHIQDKKVAGILIEIQSQGSFHRIIVGIGINVFDAPKISNLENTPTPASVPMPASTSAHTSISSSDFTSLRPLHPSTTSKATSMQEVAPDNQEFSSTSLHESRKGGIDECAWNGFLIEFYKKIKESIDSSKNPKLSISQRKRLLYFLNQSPLLKEKFEEILDDGSLRTKNQTILWNSL